MDLSAFLEGVLELPAADSVSVSACEPIEVNFRQRCRRRRRNMGWLFSHHLLDYIVVKYVK